ALILAWLEEEGERQRRPVQLPPTAQRPIPRGLVHVGVCALAGALVAALLLCWLSTGRGRSGRVAVTDQLRQVGLRTASGDTAGPPWPKEERVTARSNRGGFGGVGCFWAFAVAFGTVTGARALRAACALYNKLPGGEGSPGSVPELPFGKAMGITFLTSLVNAVVGFRLLSGLIGLLVMAALISALLP